MTCDEFVDEVCDLAGGGLTDAVRNAALSHVAGCNHCAARLAAERCLNEVLGMAARADIESAPDSVRQALLQAFIENKVPAHDRRVSIASPKWLAVAAAAALLAIVLLISLRVTGRRSVGQVPLEPQAPEILCHTSTQETATKPVAPAPQYGKEDKPFRHMAKPGRLNGKAAGLSAKAANLERVPSDSYALTDFIPLTHLSTTTAISSGQVIRIRVPLSAFLPLGLPVSPEHADELVNAELVVGDDGVQRAVRLVR